LCRLSIKVDVDDKSLFNRLTFCFQEKFHGTSCV